MFQGSTFAALSPQSHHVNKVRLSSLLSSSAEMVVERRVGANLSDEIALVASLSLSLVILRAPLSACIANDYRTAPHWSAQQQHR